MSQDHAAVEQWLFEQFATAIGNVFEAMAGARPKVTWEPAKSLPEQAGVTWRQPYPPLAGHLFAAVTEEDAAACGNHILVAAGVDDGTAEDLESTYIETLGQALSSVASFLTTRIQREVTTTGGEETGAMPEEAVWATISLKLGERTHQISIGLEPALIDSLLAADAELAAPAPAAKPPAASGHTGPSASPGAPATSESEMDRGPGQAEYSTFDLLLDVEMPVTVSFGRARVALKEVIKLTTGSIVELDRAVAEPVDVVVNNCVIARGEVVVVEGNFGVRIQQVVSRSERLRTLQ